MRHIDEVIVKGKTEPVGVYEILDFHDVQSFPNLMEVVGHFKEGRNHFVDGSWNRAIQSFEKALSANKNDRLSSIYIERCQKLKASPPKNWDGVW